MRKAPPVGRGLTPRQAGRIGQPYGSTPVASGVQGWEMIEPGRYQPRRTRGSFPGRELG